MCSSEPLDMPGMVGAVLQEGGSGHLQLPGAGDPEAGWGFTLPGAIWVTLPLLNLEVPIPYFPKEGLSFTRGSESSWLLGFRRKSYQSLTDDEIHLRN